MAKKTASANSPSTIAQRFSPSTIQSMDLLRWYVALANEADARGSKQEDKDLAPRDSRNQIATQALVWFTKPANNKSVVYPALSSKWVFASFTVPNELYRSISEIAARDEIRVARVIETAFQLYCAAVITDEMKRYYDSVQKHATALLRTSEKKRDR